MYVRFSTKTRHFVLIQQNTMGNTCFWLHRIKNLFWKYKFKWLVSIFLILQNHGCHGQFSCLIGWYLANFFWKYMYMSKCFICWSSSHMDLMKKMAAMGNFRFLIWSNIISLPTIQQIKIICYLVQMMSVGSSTKMPHYYLFLVKKNLVQMYNSWFWLTETL